MTKPRIPPHVKHLHPGDMTHCTSPEHRIRHWIEHMPDREFELLPTPRGYFVRCTRRKPPGKLQLEVVK